jgi:hypothetical protein
MMTAAGNRPRRFEKIMGTAITWRPHELVSSLHAAHALCCNLPLADVRLTEAIQAPAARLAADISAAHLPAARFWGHLIPLAARTESRRQLVETAVTKTIGRGPRFEAVVTALMASLAAVEAAARTALPQLSEELMLRGRPLREQWEARGPGLLREIGRLTDESLLPEQCEVLLVHPALGGGGAAHLAYNSVRLEGVLANPLSELPEVVRLAWLIAQLHVDLPRHSESIHADRLPQIAGLALLPAALAAAEAVELTHVTPDTLRLAITAWRLPIAADPVAPTLVAQWWQTYQETRPPWNVALAALDQLLAAAA